MLQRVLTATSTIASSSLPVVDDTLIVDFDVGSTIHNVAALCDTIAPSLRHLFFQDVERYTDLLFHLDCPENFLGDSSTPLPMLDASVPTIVITPCTSERPAFCCHVPVQDSAYNNKLTVPQHPLHNHLFPPMTVPSKYAYSSNVAKRWIYYHGHWFAVMPALQDQATEGLFSKMATSRQPKSKRRGRSPSRSRSLR